MPFITVQEANAWADGSKLILTDLDSALESSVSSQVLAEISQAYDVSSWLSPVTTPSLVRKIIAMTYMGWYYERTYSEDTDTSDYGIMLLTKAEDLTKGIIDGKMLLSDLPVLPSTLELAGQPGYLATEPIFSIGTIW